MCFFDKLYFCIFCFLFTSLCLFVSSELVVFGLASSILANAGKNVSEMTYFIVIFSRKELYIEHTTYCLPCAGRRVIICHNKPDLFPGQSYTSSSIFSLVFFILHYTALYYNVL